MSAEFEEVERPTRWARSGPSLTSAIIATAETGKAIRLIGRKSISGFIQGFRAKGYRLHGHRDGNDLIVWCDKITPNGSGETR